MGAGARVTLVSFLGGGIVLLVAVGIWSSQPDLVLLGAGYAPEDAARITTQLSDDKIQYKYEASRGAIYVPATRKDALSLKTATIPHSNEGFEIFDKQSFGATDFMNRINLQRALQGTLARSIQTLDAVASVDVILPQMDPDQQVFKNDVHQLQASVRIQLRPGKEQLSEENVNAIRYLVASSITKLEPRSVAVVVNGIPVAKPQEADDAMGLSSEQMSMQKRVEKNMVEKVESLLRKIVGEDQYAVRVTAQLNFDRKESTSQKMDPEQKLLMEESIRKDESSGPASGTSGVPGTASNTGGAAPVAIAAADKNTKKQSSTTNKYQYAMETVHLVPEVGSIKQLTVAVVVARKTKVDGDKKILDTARTPAELIAFRDLIKSAVLYAKDNDIKVQEQEFPSNVEIKATPAAAPSQVVEYLQKYLSDGLAFVGILIMAFVFRRMFSKMTLEMPTASDIGPAYIAEQIRGPSPQDDLRQMVSQKNTQAVEAIRSMLK